MERTLFVTDLDGTLLRDDQTLSAYTEKTLNSLIDAGMCFSYATARSHGTSQRVMKGIRGNFPVSVYNGAFVVERESGKMLSSSAFSHDESDAIISEILSFGVSPRVYAMINGAEKFTYTEKHLESAGAKAYFKTRGGDVRARLGSESDLYEGDIFTVSCTGEREKLSVLYEGIKNFCQCHFYPDNYSCDWYLEVTPINATKKHGVLKLAEIFGADKIVAFGDAENDIPMFSICDECYAVKNASKKIKRIADGVIGSNEEDGVAKFLLKRI